MKNIIFPAFIFAAMLITAIAVVSVNGKGTESESSYAIGNDGGYIPVYKVNCTAQRIADTVEVIWNGNEYSAYVSPESEIKTGDKIRCTFIIYEGNVELVDIN